MKDITDEKTTNNSDMGSYVLYTKLQKIELYVLYLELEPVLLL